MNFTILQAAEAIADKINNAGHIYRGKVWKRTDDTEARVYVYYSRGSKGKKDCGYINVTANGITKRLKFQQSTIESLCGELIPEIKIVSEQPRQGRYDSLFSKIVEKCYECGAAYTTYGNVYAEGMECRNCA